MKDAVQNLILAQSRLEADILKRVLAQTGERAIVFTWGLDPCTFGDEGSINISNLHDPSTLSALRKVIERTNIKSIYDLNFSIFSSINQELVKNSLNSVQSINNIINCSDLAEGVNYVYRADQNLISDSHANEEIDINIMRPKSILSAGQHYAINLIKSNFDSASFRPNVLFSPDYNFGLIDNKYYPRDLIKYIKHVFYYEMDPILFGDPLEEVPIFDLNEFFSCMVKSSINERLATHMQIRIERISVKNFIDICFEIIGKKLLWELKNGDLFGFLPSRESPVFICNNYLYYRFELENEFENEFENLNSSFDRKRKFLIDSIGQLMNLIELQ